MQFLSQVFLIQEFADVKYSYLVGLRLGFKVYGLGCILLIPYYESEGVLLVVLDPLQLLIVFGLFSFYGILEACHLLQYEWLIALLFHNAILGNSAVPEQNTKGSTFIQRIDCLWVQE